MICDKCKGRINIHTTENWQRMSFNEEEFTLCEGCTKKFFGWLCELE